MDPSSIITAISAAKSAIDAAVKVKENFFNSKNSAKYANTALPDAGFSLELLQGEIDLHKKSLSDVMVQVEENRTILEKQNEIIIGLSNALKVTAETAKTLKTISIAACITSVLAIAIALFVAFS